jgi:uncharacterized membrane protein YhaH (DUF805 family)|tara:strand:+ start:1300 stop:1542 length:243 start_codon:yes stop_codon:yes gene_type:complete
MNHNNKMNRKGQILIANFLMIVMILIIIFFANKVISPVIESQKADKPIAVQVLMSLILPLLYLVTFLFSFKILQRGEGGA